MDLPLHSSDELLLELRVAAFSTFVHLKSGPKAEMRTGSDAREGSPIVQPGGLGARLVLLHPRCDLDLVVQPS